MSARGARVHVPPPLIFVGGWGVAWLLHQRLPFDIAGAGAGRIQSTLALALLVAGVLMMGWAIRTLLFSRTTILPSGVVRQLVTYGPFRFSRNPIYLGMTSIYLGAALLANLAWPLVVLPAVLALVSSLVIAREEAHLRERFGAEYDAYVRRVRRWL